MRSFACGASLVKFAFFVPLLFTKFCNVHSLVRTEDVVLMKLGKFCSCLCNINFRLSLFIIFVCYICVDIIEEYYLSPVEQIDNLLVQAKQEAVLTALNWNENFKVLFGKFLYFNKWSEILHFASYQIRFCDLQTLSDVVQALLGWFLSFPRFYSTFFISMPDFNNFFSPYLCLSAFLSSINHFILHPCLSSCLPSFFPACLSASIPPFAFQLILQKFHICMFCFTCCSFGLMIVHRMLW